MSPVGERRLSAFLSSILLPMSCFSCYYFLRGMEVYLICVGNFLLKITQKVGNSFVLRILLESSGYELAGLMMFLYCGVQVAMEYRDRK